MDPAALAWLLSQLGPTTPTNDLTTRYNRLGTARAVALEILAERRATLLAEPLRLVVDGVVTMDRTANLSGVERQVASLQDALGPDEATLGTDSGRQLDITALLTTRLAR